VWFPTSDGSSLLVEDGERITIGSDDPEVSSVVLRPLTAAALMVTCGILTPSPARLSDQDSFERLDTTEGYVDVKHPAPDGRIGGFTPSFLRRILTVLDPEAPVPTSVRLRPAPPRAGFFGAQQVTDMDLLDGRRNIGAGQGLNDIEMPVPEILSGFGIVTVVPKLIDIVVGFNSTLFLDFTITQLMVNDFLCYEGAQVHQESDYLAADIFGTMMGGLHEVIYEVEGERLVINDDRLAQQAVFI
jgi:hypothetical protein